MPLEAPRWWWIALAVALLVLALGGALNAVEEGMRDNHASDGCGYPYGGTVSPDEQPEGVDCRGQRLAIGVVAALASATFGPGLALTILAGVYLIGSAIALALGGRPEKERPERKDAGAEAAGKPDQAPVTGEGRPGRFSIPRRWALLVVTGLALLAVAGAADSLGDAMRDNYVADCDVFGLRGVEEPRVDPGNGTEGENATDDKRTPPTQEEREACRAARLPVTVVDVITRAAMGPGIAIVSLTGVFIVASAIGMRRR